MGILFKCTTKEGYMFKILGEILHNTLKTVNISINKNGIFSKMMDNHKKFLINIEMPAKNFGNYLCETTLLFGLHIGHFYKIISSVKKKDIITLLIEEDNPNELQIIVTPRERDHTEVSKINIQNIQSIDIDVPNSYDHPIHVSSTKFQKMCKDMLNIGKEVNVYGDNNCVIFECETPGIYRKKICFGNDGSTEENCLKTIYKYNFESEQLVKISKISSLGNILYIYLDGSLPLLINSNIGSLGSISIFMKSSQI